MEHRRSQARMIWQLKIMQCQVGHAWGSTTALYTGVSGDFKNRMLRQALDRAYTTNTAADATADTAARRGPGR